MPIYEYKCNACGEHSEFIQKMNEEPMKECPHCHKCELNRLISAVGFQLKGSGWYVTDFKDQKGKAKPATSTSGEKTTESKDGKSETKKSDATSSGDAKSSSDTKSSTES